MELVAVGACREQEVVEEERSVASAPELHSSSEDEAPAWVWEMCQDGGPLGEAGPCEPGALGYALG